MGYSQLWIAPDHLLLLKSSRIAEEYQRFALADIQALVVTELPDRLQFVKFGGALLWTALALIVTSSFARWFFMVTGAVLILAAIIDLARGQKCRCYLHTAVSRELLAPVRRMRIAAQFLARTRPAIEAVQGSLSGDFAELAQAAGTASPVEAPPEVPRPTGYAMEILFGLLLVDAALIPLFQRFPNLEPGTNVAALLTTFVAEVGLAAAIVFRGKRDPRRAARMVAGLVLVCMAADLFGIGRATVTWFQDLALVAQRQQTTPPVFGWPPSSAWVYYAFGWRICAGLAGMAAARFMPTSRASA